MRRARHARRSARSSGSSIRSTAREEFVNRNGEFTVNIALVQHGVPVLGVVFAPALDRLFAGAAGVGAWVEERGGRRPIRVRAPCPRRA